MWIYFDFRRVRVLRHPSNRFLAESQFRASQLRDILASAQIIVLYGQRPIGSQTTPLGMIVSGS
jgi:hypothetical protein